MKLGLSNDYLPAEVSVFFHSTWEGRGFSPATEKSHHVGALAPEDGLLQGLKARFNRVLRLGGAKAPLFRETLIGTRFEASDSSQGGFTYDAKL